MTQRPLCRRCGKPIAKRTRWAEVFPEPLSEYQIDYGGRFTGGGVFEREDVKVKRTYFPRHVVGKPKTKAECQALVGQLSNELSNEPLTVVSVRRGKDLTITGFTTWDGKSYDSPFFCSGKCAIEFAYILAHQGCKL